jgi:hypothetical protein
MECNMEIPDEFFELNADIEKEKYVEELLEQFEAT